MSSTYLYRVKPNGIVEYNDIRGFPATYLNPTQQRILEFLVTDPVIFRRIASQDGNAQSLSPDDIKYLSANRGSDKLSLNQLQATPFRAPGGPGGSFELVLNPREDIVTSPQKPTVQNQALVEATYPRNLQQTPLPNGLPAPGVIAANSANLAARVT